METKIATSITQSKILIDLGIDVNTADMTYNAIVVSGEDKMLINGWTLNVGLYSAIKDNDFSYRNGYTFPAWSLSALIELMPSATLDSSNDHHYRLRCMEKFTEWHKNIIDAAFEMVKYLLENKNPKSEEEQIKELAELKNELLNSIK